MCVMVLLLVLLRGCCRGASGIDGGDGDVVDVIVVADVIRLWLISLLLVVVLLWRLTVLLFVLMVLC